MNQPFDLLFQVYTQKDQDDALSNLMSVICRHINGTKPEVCNG
jgi:hypothetical protein